MTIEDIFNALKVNPKSSSLWLMLGKELLSYDDVARAVNVLEQAISFNACNSEAWCQLGIALRRSGNILAATQKFRQAVYLDPLNELATCELALSLLIGKNFEEALPLAQKAIEAYPNNGNAWLIYCMATERQGLYEASLVGSDYVIQLLPENPESWLRRGIALNRLERHEEAIEAYKVALTKKPLLTDAQDNLAQSYQLLNRLDEAEACFHQTINMAGQSFEGVGVKSFDENDLGSRHFHLAILELMRGEYKRGFDRYRARFKEIGGYKRPKLGQPLWRGESLKDKTILIYHEQGYGDVLMLARYLPLLKELGACVVFAIFPAMHSFFKEWEGIDCLACYGSETTIFAEGVLPPQYDYYASVFDLPYRFATSLETVPSHVPYLPLPVIDPSTALSGDGRPKIGVIWAGNPHPLNMKRSMPLSLFSQLFKEQRVQFYSLTRDIRSGDEEYLNKYHLIDLRQRINSFSHSACFMRQMDLIITCDSATAHLAGGLARPVWTFLQFNPAWQWMLERDDSPWYPTMRLFRQSHPGDWENVLLCMQEALQEFIAAIKN